ncbi:MAG: CpsD/CapB family tyrosine-protein kinase, partial [Acutalibacteraceae bacterium]
MGLHKKKKNFISSDSDSTKMLHKNLNFTATEQYKIIRANLDFTLPADEKCPIIGVTSSMRGEGKSVTAINLSYVLAERGSNVLLIDGDLRLPSIAKKLNIESSPGLTDLLKGKGAQMVDFRSDVLNSWYILPSGAIPPNPSELLGSKKMQDVLAKLREMFDYIIIDL